MTNNSLTAPQNRALALLQSNGGTMTRREFALAYGNGWRTVMGSLRKKGAVLGTQDPETLLTTYTTL